MTLWESIQREIDEANRRAIEIIKPSEQETERGLRVHGDSAWHPLRGNAAAQGGAARKHPIEGPTRVPRKLG